MRRLENDDEEKFWEAWVKDAIFYYRFGKIGSPGQTKLKRFSTDAEAEVELEEKLQEKLTQGFAEPGATKEASDKDEESDEESEEEDDKEEEGEDEEEDEAKPKKTARKKAPHVAAVAAGPAKPTLPVRFQKHATKADQINPAKAAIEALRAGLGGRSWKVARLARKARQALERVGGIDPHDHGPFGQTFDALMDDVFADKKKLPLEVAMQLLFELDAKVFVRTVKRWKTKAGASPLKDAIGMLQTSAELGDAELALHTAAALANRQLDARAWKKRFAKVRPFLEEALAKSGSSVGKFTKTLHAGEDKTLHAHVEEMGR
jgi:predicted DNA-binding WGR domain protein